MATTSSVLFARLASRTRLRQWQLALQVGTLGNLHRAAAAVNMSQPAATQALADLEATMGAALFERHAKGTRLTAMGEAVFPLIRNALQSLEECAEIAVAMQAGNTDKIRLGAIGAATSGLLTRALPNFSVRRPQVAVEVEQLSPAELLQGLADATLDGVLMRPPSPLPAMTRFVPIRSDRYAIVCSTRHPLAGRGGVSLEDLARQRWLVPPSSSIAERDFSLMWHETTPPTDICWIESRISLLMWAAVEQREALVLMPYNACWQWIEAGVLAEIPGKWGPALDPIGLLVPADAPRGPGALADLIDELLRCSDLGAAQQPPS